MFFEAEKKTININIYIYIYGFEPESAKCFEETGKLF